MDVMIPVLTLGIGFVIGAYVVTQIDKKLWALRLLSGY